MAELELQPLLPIVNPTFQISDNKEVSEAAANQETTLTEKEHYKWNNLYYIPMVLVLTVILIMVFLVIIPVQNATNTNTSKKCVNISSSVPSANGNILCIAAKCKNTYSIPNYTNNGKYISCTVPVPKAQAQCSNAASSFNTTNGKVICTSPCGNPLSLTLNVSNKRVCTPPQQGVNCPLSASSIPTAGGKYICSAPCKNPLSTYSVVSSKRICNLPKFCPNASSQTIKTFTYGINTYCQSKSALTYCINNNANVVLLSGGTVPIATVKGKTGFGCMYVLNANQQSS